MGTIDKPDDVKHQIDEALATLTDWKDRAVSEDGIVLQLTDIENLIRHLQQISIS